MVTQKKTTHTRKKTSGKKTSGRKSSTNGRKNSSSAPTFTWRAELLLFAFLAFAILLFIGNIGKGGIVGNALSTFSFGMFGVLAYIFPIPVFLIPAFMVSNRQRTRNGYTYSGRAIMKATAGILLFVFLCVFAHIVCWWDQVPGKVTQLYIECASSKTGGGLIGGLIGIGFSKCFGMMGAVLLDILIMVIAVVLLTEKSFFKGVSRGSRHVYESARSDAARRRAAAQERSRERQSQREQTAGNDRKKERRMNRKVSGVALDTKIRPRKEEKVTENMSELSLNPQDPIGEEVVVGSNPKAGAEKKRKTAATVQMPVTESEDITQVQSDDFWAQHPQPEIHLSGEQNPYLEGQKPVRETTQPRTPRRDDAGSEAAGISQPEPELKKKSHHRGQPKQSAEQVEQEVTDVREEIAEHAGEEHVRAYVFPEVSLLQKGDPNQTGDSRQHLQEMSAKLQMTLTNFGVNARVTNVICGPTVTQYEIQPEMGVKVSKILGLADDIKLNLAVPDIRFEAPIPGKSAIGIEVPNKENVTIPFRDLVESREFQDHASKISFCTGKDIAGHVIVADLSLIHI